MSEQLETLKTWINESDNIVFFGGAGVSTESGIPDFRSVDGLYHQQYDYPPETIFKVIHSLREIQRNFTGSTGRRCWLLMQNPMQPIRSWQEWEQQGKLKAVVTQNIDGLHQAAGSKVVYELHGSVHRNYCQKCGAFYDARYMLESTGIPRCRNAAD